MTTLSGTVKNAANAALACTVRAYRRDTGACTVVVLGEDGGTENALIYDRVIPA